MYRLWRPWRLFLVLIGIALALAQLGPARALASTPPVVAVEPSGPSLMPQAPPGCQAATRTFSQPAAQPIHDLSTITSTLPVNGLPPIIWSVIAHTAISHTFPSDLEVYLLPPNQFGFRNTLTTHNGGGNDNVYANTTWSDQASLGVTEVGFANGVNQPLLIPEGAMGAHHNHNPNGNWNLIVADTVASDTGTLNSWSLSITTLPFMPIGASQFLNNNASQAIPDLGTITSTVNVSNAGPVLDEVTIEMVVPHSKSGDLDITLMAPGGLTTTLTSGNGGTNADQFNGTTFTDGPVTNNRALVTDAQYTNGVALDQTQPEGALGHFRGINPNGTWSLIISDNTPGGAGSLVSWQLAIYTSHCEALFLPTVRR